MKKIKSILLTTILETLFTILIILSLVYIRHQSIDYINEIHIFSNNINFAEEEITNQNLTFEERQNIDNVLTSLDKILNNALILLQVVLPILVIVLSLVFYYLIWRLTSEISIKRFLAYSIIPLILFLAVIFFSLNYIAYSYLFIENNPKIQLISSIVLLITFYYISLFGLSNKKSLKQNLKLSVKYFPKILLPYTLVLITNVLYVIVGFYLFFLTFVKAPILVHSIILFVLITILNLERFYIVNKISTK